MSFECKDRKKGNKHRKKIAKKAVDEDDNDWHDVC